MSFLAPIIVAFGMFSRIPVPAVEWSPRSMRYALCAFPLVGAAQGLAGLLWGYTATAFALPPQLTAVVFTLLPVWVNGGIHLDGLCDTADALASHATREKKLQILKDPHIGAFGVLALACHLLLTFALFTAFTPGLRPCLALLCIYVLSRALSGWAMVCWPAAKAEGTANRFHAGSAGGRAAACLLATAVLGGLGLVLLLGIHGVCVALAAVVVLPVYRRMARKQFGGVTGDLAGWFLQTAELCMLAILVMGGLLL